MVIGKKTKHKFFAYKNDIEFGAKYEYFLNKHFNSILNVKKSFMKLIKLRIVLSSYQ